MGFGNHTPYKRAAPPDPTFGELREDGFGYTVRCLKCRHSRAIGPKEARFLRARLPDTLKLSDAGAMFKCSQCNSNRVRLAAEDAWERHQRLRQESSIEDQ